jgi:hypothetical protein
MRKTLFLWIGVLALLAGVGCKKNSSTAAGSESCLINGNSWVASSAALAASNPNEPAAFTSDDTLFVVNGQGAGYYYSAITIKVSTQGPDFSVGTPIPISGYNTAALLTYFTDSSCMGNTVVNGLAISGSLTITKLDTVHREIAGTFSATVPMPCDTIQITDGQFDQTFIAL